MKKKQKENKLEGTYIPLKLHSVNTQYPFKNKRACWLITDFCL